MSAASNTSKRILIGKIMGAFGVRGELKILSHTAPETALLRYQPWTLRDARGREWQVTGAKGRAGSKGVVASIPDIQDRDAAEALRGVEIHVPRSALPAPKPGEYYWVDLQGLQVETVEGVPLGHIDHVFSTGANDVICVRGERERLIPFIQPNVVRQVNFEAGLMVVDWDPEF
ncbi:ribosome maturation factor RimM [Lysobacteraceae bacterium NML03-0222]|nr:ribosome maturation factor RimM [Xanthomonadaceae bacterium NML03-0222]